MSSMLDVLVRPVVTEKAMTKKESEATLCFEVMPSANKIQIKKAVEKMFKVKVAVVRTLNNEGKLRRRGRFSGYRSDWKKAYVTLQAGQKMPEYVEL